MGVLSSMENEGRCLKNVQAADLHIVKVNSQKMTDKYNKSKE